MIVNSNADKIKKSAWLLNTKDNIFTSLQLQKFLFFYEMFARVNNKEYNIDRLRAYENGPVFSPVYGDYRHRTQHFLAKLNEITDFSGIYDKIARSAKLLTESMTDDEVSELTHQFDLWSVHEAEVKAGKKNISINIHDISKKDDQISKRLYEYYSKLEDLNYEALQIDNKVFMMPKETLNNLKDKHYSTLVKLSKKDDLINPVFISTKTINEKEVLLVD